MIDECSSLAGDWEQLSGFLGLSFLLIDNIKRDHPQDATGCWNDALKHWINQNYNIQKFGVPSWRSLLKVIPKLNLRLFKDLAAKHQLEGVYLS